MLVLEDGVASKVAAVLVVSAVLVELCTELAEKMLLVVVSGAELVWLDVAALEDVIERLDGMVVAASEDMLESVPAGTMVKFIE